MVELTKPIVRRLGNLVVRIAREGISIKEYRCRSWLGPVPWGSVELEAGKIEAGFAAAHNPRKPRRRRMAGEEGTTIATYFLPLP